IGAGSKFGEQVEDTLRHWPAEHAVAAEFGGCVVCDEQHIRPGCVWRRQSEPVIPDSKPAAAAQLVCNQAHRLGSIARGDGELEVRQDDLAEGVQHHGNPRSRLITGWLVPAMMRSRKAVFISCWNESSGHTGSAITLSASKIS